MLTIVRRDSSQVCPIVVVAIGKYWKCPFNRKQLSVWADNTRVAGTAIEAVRSGDKVEATTIPKREACAAAVVREVHIAGFENDWINESDRRNKFLGSGGHLNKLTIAGIYALKYLARKAEPSFGTEYFARLPLEAMRHNHFFIHGCPKPGSMRIFAVPRLDI